MTRDKLITIVTSPPTLVYLSPMTAVEVLTRLLECMKVFVGCCPCNESQSPSVVRRGRGGARGRHASWAPTLAFADCSCTRYVE
ncbi:unnamed protein product [Danaus chrysippus]|uniref:(African queen) hypothetical protein n=1 Tax=Danaus chrysippus TaxID=151541 RepID=A0A8J2QQB8_9NEOP|nr:unnamed protein product [Danaus chrysippus]